MLGALLAWDCRMRDLTHSYVLHECVTRRHMWDVTLSRVTWLIHVWEVTICGARLIHVWHTWFTCVTWLINTRVTYLIHMCYMTHQHTCDILDSHVLHDSSKHVDMHDWTCDMLMRFSTCDMLMSHVTRMKSLMIETCWWVMSRVNEACWWVI